MNLAKRLKEKLDQNKLVKHFIVYLTSGGIAKVIPMLILFLIANLLTPTEFGLVSNFGVIVQLFGAFVSLKLGTIVQAEYYGQSVEERKDSVSNLLYLMCSITAILIFLSVFFESLFLEYLKLGSYWVILAAIVGLCTNIFGIRTVILRMDEKPKKFAYFQIGNAVIVALLNVLFVIVLGWSWEGRIYATFGASIAMLLLTFGFFLKEGWFPRKINLSRMKEYLFLGLPLFPHAITPFLNSSVEKIVITDQLGLSFNGLYSFAITISTIFLMIVQAFYSAYTPSLYKTMDALEKSEGEESLKLKRKIVMQSLGAFATLFGLILLGYLFAWITLTFFFNSNYLDALYYLPWVLMRVFLHSIFLMFSYIVVYTKQTKILGISAFAGTVINAGLVLLLVPEYGVFGVLYAIVVVAILRLCFVYVLSQKYYPLPWLKLT